MYFSYSLHFEEIIVLMQIIESIKKKVNGKLFPDRGSRKFSYAQQGEDLILDFLFRWELQIEDFTFIDIGAHDPFYLSNTYLFYRRGCYGISIEPDPRLFNRIKKYRTNDINLNIGIGGVDSVLDFYIMTSKTLSTFSKEEAEEIIRTGKYGKQRIESVIKVEVKTLKSILIEYPITKPFFISIDVEGWDLEILKTIDFKIINPVVICIEKNKNGKEIDKYMIDNNYTKYADNYTNAIYVSKYYWRKQ